MEPVHPFLRERARLLRVVRFDPAAQGYDAPQLLADRQRPFRLRQAMLLATAAIALGVVAAQVGGAGPAGARPHRQPVIGSARNAAIGFIALTAEQGGCPPGLQRAYITPGGAAPAEASCWRKHGSEVLVLDRRGAESSYPAARFGLVAEQRP